MSNIMMCVENAGRRGSYVQEVPAFRDFWYQKGITKFGDHEF